MWVLKFVLFVVRSDSTISVNLPIAGTRVGWPRGQSTLYELMRFVSSCYVICNMKYICGIFMQVWPLMWAFDAATKHEI